MNNYVYENISKEAREKILDRLLAIFPNSTEKDLPHCSKSCQLSNLGNKVTLLHYNSGKLMLQGNCSELKTALLEIEEKFSILESTSQKKAKSKEISSGESNIDSDYFIGFDEAGKGECFGPLILGSVIFKKENLKLLKDRISGRDIKKLDWDQIEKLYNSLRGLFELKIFRISSKDIDEKNLNDLMDEGYSKLIKQISTNPSREAFFIDNYGVSSRLNTKLSELKDKGAKIVLGEKVDLNYVAGALASLIARRNRNTEMRRLSKDSILINEQGEQISFKSGAPNEESRTYLETYRRLHPYANLPIFVRKSWKNIKQFEEEFPKSKLSLSYFCENCKKRNNLVCFEVSNEPVSSNFFCSNCGESILQKNINPIIKNKEIVVDTSTILSRYITKDIQSNNYFDKCSFVLTSDIYEEIDSKQPTWKIGATKEIDELKSLSEEGKIGFRYLESGDNRGIPIDKKLISATKSIGGIMVTKDSNLAAFSITSGFVIKIVENKESHFKQQEKLKKKIYRGNS